MDLRCRMKENIPRISPLPPSNLLKGGGVKIAIFCRINQNYSCKYRPIYQILFADKATLKLKVEINTAFPSSFSLERYEVSKLCRSCPVLLETSHRTHYGKVMHHESHPYPSQSTNQNVGVENSPNAITDSGTANSACQHSNFNMVAWKAREALMKPSSRSCQYTFEVACAWQYNQLQTNLALRSNLIFLTCVWNVQSIRFKRKEGLLFTLGNKVCYVN